MASGVAPVCALKSPGVLVEFEAPPFIAILVTPDPIRSNGEEYRFLSCGSTKSTLVPCCLSALDSSWAIEFLKSASNLDCMAQELSAHCVHSGL